MPREPLAVVGDGVEVEIEAYGSKGVLGPLIYPRTRDPDMSGLGAGHVWFKLPWQFRKSQKLPGKSIIKGFWHRANISTYIGHRWTSFEIKTYIWLEFKRIINLA
jgi:hypothetical protein